jgi:hypothetical protein
LGILTVVPERSTKQRESRANERAPEQSGSRNESGGGDPPTSEQSIIGLATDQGSGLSHERRRQLRSLEEFS